MDQGGQRRDQVDAAVVQDVRRQRGAAPASRTRPQSWQLPADADEGKADQDRRRDLERCALRPGNVHNADGGEGVLHQPSFNGFFSMQFPCRGRDHTLTY
jgi:hypothetical protein